MVLNNLALTGASGMVGIHLIRCMKEIKISGQLSSRTRPRVSGSLFSWVPWDLKHWKTPEELDGIFPNVQAVIHAGAMIPTSAHPTSERVCFDTNVRACLCLAEWALSRNLPIVYISGATVYEDPHGLNITETDRLSKSGGFGGFYGYSKLLGERIFHYFVEKGLKACILRPSSIFGYGLDRKKMLPHFLYLASQNKTIELKPPFDDRINLLHVEDLCNAIFQVIAQEVTGIYNIANKDEVSIEEIAKTCVEIVGSGLVNVLPGETSKKALVRFNLSCKKAAERFGYSSRIPFKAGLEKMWNEFKEE